MTSNRGFTTFEVLISVLIVACIAVVGWAVFHANESSPAKPARSGGQPVSLPKGNLDDTFTYDDKAFPRLASGYTQIYQTATTAKIAETDYVVDKNSASVRSDVVNICNTHGFKFQNAGDAKAVECISRDNSWKFIISAGTEIKKQPWYSQQTIPENGTWLRIESSGAPVFN